MLTSHGRGEPHNSMTHVPKGARPDVCLPDVRTVRAGEEPDIPFKHVVLPVPGSHCRFPQHLPTRRLYDDVMQHHNFQAEKFSESQQSYLEGAYRHIVAVPLSFHAQSVAYVEPCSRLVESALDRIKGRFVEPDCILHLEDAVGETQLELRTGVIVKLALRPGQYATVAMREFMKGPPRNEFHSAW